MRRIKLVVGIVAIMAAMVVASAASAFARGHHDDWQRCCAGPQFVGPFGFGFFNDFGDDDNGFERQNVDINCPVVGVIADNGSTVNNSCNPLVASDL
jgi:hypothetical protein